ncbi:MAG TPA: metalloregulator ArsR/SmtB family transcription factor [Solirubrobacteraceae bacterium]|nr:metalloregulator ArsR/SmtB family transcription factor [Solirubrobacteraceae bacterium]
MLNYLPPGAPAATLPPPPPERVFHALGDPSRMAIVEQLSEGPASVSDLARPLAISLPAVMQHLAVLEADGLVSSRKVGRVRTCRIEPAGLRAAGDWVSQRRELWERSLDRLGEYLDRQAASPESPQPSGRPRRAASARPSKPTRPTKEKPR